MSQIFLFTGENEYELRRKRSLWIAEFSKKHGPENVNTTEASSITLSTLMDEVSAAPFIAEKRLIVVDGIPKLEKDQFADLEKVLHPQVLLLFVEPKPDKRLGGTKALLKIAQTETFNPRAGSQLIAWMSTLAKEVGAELPQDVAHILIDVVGQDQMQLATEIRKLSTYAHGRAITADDILELSMLSGKQMVWKLLDLLSARKKDEALQFTYSIVKRGEDPYGLWSMFLWMVSRIAMVASLQLEGKSPQAISKECGMHPRTVSNVLSLTKTFTPQKITELVSLVAQTDVDLKTGAYKHTAESPEELNALIDTRIAAVC